MYPDVVVAGALSLLVGPMLAIELGRFAPRDVALTALEGVSALRLLDVLHDGWHSLNVAAWPVRCRRRTRCPRHRTRANAAARAARATAANAAARASMYLKRANAAARASMYHKRANALTR